MPFLPKPPFTKIGLLFHLNQYSAIGPAIMSTHAHLASPSGRPCVPIEPEIVDDSEPERIELQKTLNKQLRTSAETLHSPRIITHNNDLKHVDKIPVIEISDSDSQLAVSSSKYTRIQDIDDRGQDQVRSTNSDYKLPKPSTSHMQFSAAMHNPSEDESSKGSSKLNLDRFVFKSSRMARNLQVSTGSTPSTGSAMLNSTAKGLKQKRLPLSSDVAQISRCVCCNVRWTARKSGAQKMTHIQSCAKKHALDSETINLLIQKQISLDEPVLKKTLFENVLVDAAPKQKVKRRRKEEGSLKTVSTSRASILARAQGILSTLADDSKYQSGSSFSGSTQGHSELPSTQAFGSSGLAQMQNFESNTFSLNGPGISDDNSDQGGSEAQPAFLASCLSSHPLKIFGDYEPDHKGTRSAEPSFNDKLEVETNYTLNPKRFSPSSIEGRGMTSSRVPRTPAPDSSPELSILTNLTIHSLAPTLKSKKIKKAVAKGRLKVSSHSDEPTLLSDRATPKKKKGSSKETTSKITHEEWQLHLMRNIKLDIDLHLRILRYEPIHFNVFLEIAMRYAPPISKLKQQLRTFLDDQAIIFYVNEGGRSRR